MRLIDADGLKQKITMVTKQYKPNAIMERPAILLEDVDDAPTIEAEPIRHGKWIDGGCSLCGEYPVLKVVYRGTTIWERKNKPKYCPHCGARMDEVEG